MSKRTAQSIQPHKAPKLQGVDAVVIMGYHPELTDVCTYDYDNRDPYLQKRYKSEYKKELNQFLPRVNNKRPI